MVSHRSTSERGRRRTFEKSEVESRRRVVAPFLQKSCISHEIQNLQEVSCEEASSHHRSPSSSHSNLACTALVRINQSIRYNLCSVIIGTTSSAMENGAVSSETQQGASYTYWVREARKDAAPLPVPRKLSAEDIVASQASQPPTLGSVWNRVFLVFELPHFLVVMVALDEACVIVFF